MAIGQSAGLLFKIDGDSSGLKRELAVAEGSINKFGSQFSNIAGIATSAASAIAIMGTAVFTAGKYLFDLTKAASDYGSAINDATQKSGASVQSIQALGFAAEQSGSSLDAIAGSVAKFSNLLGQASLGNKEAQETLEQFGITATTVDEALTQAIASIQSMTSETQQNAAAATLFKDRGGEVVKTIREMGGSLPDTIKKLEDMGIMMSREDTKAADAFGDSLGLLSTQVKLLGYRFANEFMPQVTAAIQSISRFLIANKDIIKGWGNDIGIVINGVANAFRMLPQVIGGVFNAINVLFGTSLSTTASWANGMRFILGPLGELFRMISGVGQMAGADIVSGASTAASSVIGQIATPKLNTGGGSGGAGKDGGGKDNAADEAEQARQKAVQAAMAEMADTLGVYKAGYASRLSLLDFNLAQKYTSELNYIRDVGRINLEALMDEKTLNEELLKNENLNFEEKKDIANKIKILEIEIRSEKRKTATAVIEEITKQTEAEDEAHKKRLKQLQEISDKRQKDFADWQNRDLARKKQERLEQTIGSGQEIGGWEQLMNSAVSNQSTLAVASIEALSGAFQGLGQAIGQVVSAWVLYGSAGTSVRKVTAQILAGIAQQAAIQAVFQLAEGFAKLAMAFFGVPNAGPSATAHFIAAGMYASIAGVAAVAGRAVAGDAFKQQNSAATGGGSGSGSNGGSNSNDPTRYTTEFGGYGTGQNPLHALIKRQNTVLGQVEETIHQFNRKVTSMTPGEVVAMGASDASRDIRQAYESELQGSVAATDRLMRGTGLAR